MSEIENKEQIQEKIVSNLKTVFDPEIPVNIYDLGLIYEISLYKKDNYLYCDVLMTLTSPACPVAESLVEQVKYVCLAVDEVDESSVNLTFNPPWSKAQMSEEAIELMAMNGAAM